MEPVIGLNCPQMIEYTSPSPNAPIWQDILAQAMTGELLAAMNYTSLSEMLESFAVASYTRVGKVASGSLGKTFAAIAAEEEEHVDHALSILRAERAQDAQRFDDKVYRLHLDVMTTLAKMLARECKDGHCEVCHGNCVKPSLFDVSLSAAELRGASLQQYLKTLNMLGLPGEVTLAWVTQLPV